MESNLIMPNLKPFAGAVFSILTLFFVALILISCSKDNEVLPSPTITSFAPTVGSVGATVTISGANFSSTTSNNTVKIGNALATVSSATTTQLTITVPTEAATGKISVTTNDKTATSTADFNVVQPPTITNFAPLGAVPGSSIVITGTNFNAASADNVVKINGVVASVTASTTTQLTATVPVGATTGKISLEINGVVVTSLNDFEVLKDIPRNGLVAIYPFTGNGNCTNNNTLSFNFSLADAPMLINDRHNRSGQAIGFSGTQFSEIIKEVLPAQPWTISFWMDPGSLTFGDHECMTSYGANLGYDITLRKNTNTLDYFVYAAHIGPAGVTYLSPQTSDLPAADVGNIWISIILTFDGNTFKVYKDGVEIVSNPITPIIPLTPGPRFRIGGDAIKPFIGKLDDIVIYNRVLNTTELTQLFQQTVSKY
ncbi:MAG TPA: IPT/TIG domain-containing protein [Cyclobacteriaceae bacterium]|nr:IPT/TIG domain-containing protein [Cyclobacteriaceae bacterium]HNT49358.1 IPT/TIG domain-containing protein [Cyclobacteriaceae bacterium]